MTLWLIWCACGLVFDVFLILWWVYELFVGDAIEALTNILISLLTMAIEFGFIYVIYTIFLNLSNATKNEETKVAEKSRYHFMMISDQKR
nr:IP18008p [Drosophila melanogaster]ABN49364.1 IP18208p [Drosophila melanogaster]